MKQSRQRGNAVLIQKLEIRQQTSGRSRLGQILNKLRPYLRPGLAGGAP